MLLLGIDFETTFTDPVDPRRCRTVEAGAVLVDTENWQPIRLFSQMCWLDAYGPFDPRITELTGITPKMLSQYGRDPQGIFKHLLGLASEADYLVAHNGTNFDKPLMETELGRYGFHMPDRHWIDTAVDVPYPKKIETRKLDFLAPAHGFLNPFAHRAVFDCLSMLKVLSFYDIHEVVRRSKAEKVKLRALTKKPWEDNGRSNQAAKDRGFRFDGGTKSWMKVVLLEEVADELANKSVEVVTLTGVPND